MRNPYHLPEQLTALVKGALVTRKGQTMLRRTAPKDRLERAAWLALRLEANPYKVGVGTLLMLTPEEREVFDAVDAAIEASPQLRAHLHTLDRDRVALTSVGVW